MTLHHSWTDAFDRLVEIEPRLHDLLQEAKRSVLDGRISAEVDGIYYPRFKPQIELLVGMYRGTGPKELQTSGAYDVVVRVIADALTNCRKRSRSRRGG